MSAFAVQTLLDAQKLGPEDLDLHRSSSVFPSSSPADIFVIGCAGPKEYTVLRKISDPLTGGSSAIFWTVTHWYGGIAQIF